MEDVTLLDRRVVLNLELFAFVFCILKTLYCCRDITWNPRQFFIFLGKLVL
eukprot:XP_001704147.1 Hypothetical protein GL50803_35700 [Giardia lamblia ATCC 50803]